MQIAARTGAWSGKELPYDAEVEWLKGDGNSYIRTGLMSSFDTEFELDISGNWGRTEKIEIFLGYDDYYENNNRRVKPFSFGNNTVSASHIDILYGSFYFGQDYTWPDNRTTFFFKDNRLYCGDVLLKESSQQSFANGGEIFLFAENAPNNPFGSVSKYCCINFRFYKIDIKNSTRTLEFRPVRFTNEFGNVEGAMYDRVSGQLFRNAGTGAFVIGPDKVGTVLAGGGIDA